MFCSCVSDIYSRGKRVGFLEQFVLFPLSDVMFRFAITSLWWDCPLRVAVALNFSRVDALRAVPMRFPRCVAGATWGLCLWITDVGDCRGFLNGPLRLKPEGGPCLRARRPMCDGFDHFCAFHRSCCPNYTIGQSDPAIYTATFEYHWLLLGGVAVGTFM